MPVNQPYGESLSTPGDRQRRLATFYAVLLTVTSPGRVLSQEDLAGQAAMANKSSVQMIQSLYADVEVEEAYKQGKGVLSARYWRENNVVRMQETGGHRTVEVLCKDGRVSSILSKGAIRNPSVASWIIGDQNRRCVETDVWEACLFTLPVSVTRRPGYPIYSAWEAIQVGRVTLARWEALGNAKVAHVTVELAPGTRTYDIWIDPGFNWLARKCTHKIYDDKRSLVWRNEHDVEDYIEARPTIYVPLRSKTVCYHKNEQVVERVLRLRNLRVNEALPAVPRWPIPDEGVRVLDQVAGTTYMVDRTGGRVGPEQRFGADYVPPVPAADPLAVENSRFWLGISFLLIAGALVVGGYALRRRLKTKLP